MKSKTTIELRVVLYDLGLTNMEGSANVTCDYTFENEATSNWDIQPDLYFTSIKFEDLDKAAQNMLTYMARIEGARTEVALYDAEEGTDPIFGND